jgi:hypothetical protein
MSDGWFYAENEKICGPMSLEELEKILSIVPDPYNLRVWKAGLSDWTVAGAVKEVASLIRTPPPLPKTPDGKQASEIKPPPVHSPPLNKQPAAGGVLANAAPKTSKKDSDRRTAFLIALFIVVCIGGILSDYIYDNSADGISYLVGQFIGALLICSLFAFPARKKTHTAAVVLAVAGVVVLIFNWSKLIESTEGKKAFTAIRTEKKTTAPVEQAAEKNPSNVMLQLIAGVKKIAEKTQSEAARLSDEIEPPELSKDINYATATRTDLETFYFALKTAQRNVSAAAPRFAALYREERSEVEKLSHQMNTTDGVRRALLGGVDDKQTRFSIYNSKMMNARGELYSSFADYIAILIEQYDHYKVQPDGRFVFADQSALQRFNNAVNLLNSAAKRVSEVEVEGKQLEKFQQEGWERVVKGQ